MILTFGLFTIGADVQMMNEDRKNLRLTGEAVMVSYVADPSVGHGRFLLENRGAEAVTGHVESAWLEWAGRRQPLLGISMFDAEKEQALDPANVVIGAHTTVRFLLGFPKVAYEPRFGESCAVGLRLRAVGMVLEAVSPIQFERRMPYGR